MGHRRRDATQGRWDAAHAEGAWAAIRGEDTDRCPHIRDDRPSIYASPFEQLSVAWHRGYRMACNYMDLGAVVGQSGRPASDCDLTMDWQQAAWRLGWRHGASQRDSL